MAEEKKKQEGWVVGLQLISEEQPPAKVFQKGEETTDLYGAVAKIMNDLEELKKLL